MPDVRGVMPVATGQTLTMDLLQIVHLEPDDFDAERVRAELKRAGIDDSLIRLRSNEELEHAIAAGSVDLVLSELKGANCDGLRALIDGPRETRAVYFCGR